MEHFLLKNESDFEELLFYILLSSYSFVFLFSKLEQGFTILEDVW